MPKKKKVLMWVVIVAVVVGGVLYFRSRKPASTVTTENVTRGTVVQTVSVTGTLFPLRYADLSFQGMGTVDAVDVKEGDVVKTGDTIASVDTSVLGSQLAQAKIAADIAYQNELLAVRNHMKKQEIAAKKLSSEQAREAVTAIAAQIGNNSIASPMDGIVTKTDVRVGETVALGKVVARVAGSTDMELEADVPESDVAKVAVGMKAKVTFDALTTLDVFTADVTRIDTSASVSQGVVSYTVRLHIADLDKRLRDGMTGNIDIETARAENAVLVPFRAIAKEGARSYVNVQRSKDVTDKVEITTGLEGDDGMIEVKSGLSEGDAVVVSTK